MSKKTKQILGAVLILVLLGAGYLYVRAGKLKVERARAVSGIIWSDNTELSGITWADMAGIIWTSKSLAGITWADRMVAQNSVSQYLRGQRGASLKLETSQSFAGTCDKAAVGQTLKELVQAVGKPKDIAKQDVGLINKLLNRLDDLDRKCSK